MKGKNILYVGSGKSALLVKEMMLDEYVVICANNAWKLFENDYFDVWIHSGDFPRYAHPKNIRYEKRISHKDYEETAYMAAKKLNWTTNSPQHYLGYTVFFLGLYWIMMKLKPKKIGLLGFDHDYNPEKVKKWEENKRPNIQNHFNVGGVKNMFEWATSFFGDLETDSFYGHGLPDPLRLGNKHLLEKFKLAEDSAEKLNIELVNYSPIRGINPIKKEKP